MRIRLSFVMALLLASACGASSGSSGSMTVKTTGAEISSLTRYRTYMHAIAENAPEGYARGALRPMVLEKAQRDVDAQLQTKGYQLAENGELVVRISSGSRTVADEPTGSAGLAGAPGKLESEGALVVDIFERGSGKQLFHGFARDVVHGGEVKDEQITRAVSKILEPVPASTAR